MRAVFDRKWHQFTTIFVVSILDMSIYEYHVKKVFLRLSTRVVQNSHDLMDSDFVVVCCLCGSKVHNPNKWQYIFFTFNSTKMDVDVGGT